VKGTQKGRNLGDKKGVNRAPKKTFQQAWRKVNGNEGGTRRGETQTPVLPGKERKRERKSQPGLRGGEEKRCVKNKSLQEKRKKKKQEGSEKN